MKFTDVWRVITIIVIEEILMANGLAVLMMCYLLSCRRKNRESLHTEDKVYDGIAKVNILGAVAETIGFLVDGKSFIGCRQLNYISNSLYMVYHSRKQGVNLSYFPVFYFVCICFAGVLIQLVFYGVTSSWLLAAVTLIFIQMQSYAENIYMDELSGLYNRRYLKAVLAKRKNTDANSLYGIMMDVNDFKYINDSFGHSMGDKAISTMGNILFKSIPNAGIAIRYAGDEFIVLLTDADKACVLATINEINKNISRFNDSKAEPFELSVSMGYAEFAKDDNAEVFLRNMDDKMYEEKRRYHGAAPSIPE